MMCVVVIAPPSKKNCTGVRNRQQHFAARSECSIDRSHKINLKRDRNVFEHIEQYYECKLVRMVREPFDCIFSNNHFKPSSSATFGLRGTRFQAKQLTETKIAQGLQGKSVTTANV